MPADRGNKAEPPRVGKFGFLGDNVCGLGLQAFLGNPNFPPAIRSSINLEI